MGPGTRYPRRRQMRMREGMAAGFPPGPAAGPPGAHAVTPAGQPRARSLGIPFAGQPGRWNAITDVPGVEVGYTTLIRGTSVRTGVTAIHPRGAAGAGDPVVAGFFSQNGNGEMTGVSWIQESGTFAGPVAITNTHAVGIAHAAIVAWAVRHHPGLAEAWLLPVVAETWDGYLNDINSPNVTERACLDALESAASGPVEEGSVGGGTGMNLLPVQGRLRHRLPAGALRGNDLRRRRLRSGEFRHPGGAHAGRPAAGPASGRRQPDGRPAQC